MAQHKAAARAPNVRASPQARQQQDLAKLLVLLALSPFMLFKLAQEACSSVNGAFALDSAALPGNLCAVAYHADAMQHRSFAGAAAYVVRNYGLLYLRLLQLRGDYAWIPSGVCVLLTAFVLGAAVPPMTYTRLVVPCFSSILGTVVPQSLQLWRLLLVHEVPMPYTWRNMRMAPLLRLMTSLTFPVTPTVDIANNLLGHVLGLACIAVARSKHPSLQANWLPDVLLTCSCTAAIVVIQLWRRQAGSVVSALTSAAGGSGAGGCGTSSNAMERQTERAGAHSSLPSGPNSVSKTSCAPEPSRSGVDPELPCAPGTATSTSTSTSTSSVWLDTLAVLGSAALWPGGEAGRRAALRPTRYRGLVRMVSVRLKLEGVEPHQLPPGWRESCVAEVAARAQGSGSFVAGVYVRNGCIELIMDVAMWVGQEGDASDDDAGSSSSGSGSSSGVRAVRLDAAALVAALQLPHAPSSVTMVCTDVGGGGVQPGGGSVSARDDFPLRIVGLQPRVVPVGQARSAAAMGVCAGVGGAAPSDDPDFSISISMLRPRHSAMCRPSLQQQDATMPEILLRAHDAYLGCTITPTPSAAAAAALLPGHGTAAGDAASDSDMTPFQVSARASGLPATPGLLMVECRCAAAGRCAAAPVLLVDDAAVAQELQASLEHWPATDHPEDMEHLLLDLGTWSQCAGSAGRDVGVVQALAGAGSCGSGREVVVGRPLELLGACLLEEALARGWLHTACWLMRGMQALGMQLHRLEPDKLLARGSPGLLRAALASRRPAVICQALLWSLQSRIPARLLAKAAVRRPPLPAKAASVSGGKGSSSRAAHAHQDERAGWLHALRLAAGLVRTSGPEEEEAFRSFSDAWIAAQARVVLLFHTTIFLCCLWSSVRSSGRLLDASCLPLLVYQAPSTAIMVACALTPPRARTRLLALSAVAQHLGVLGSYLVLVRLGLPPTPAAQAYMLGVGMAAAEGVLLPAAALVPPMAAAAISLVKAPLQASAYLQVCQLQGLACAARPNAAFLRHSGIALLSIATTLACTAYVRLRFMRLHRGTAARLPHKD